MARHAPQVTLPKLGREGLAAAAVALQQQEDRQTPGIAAGAGGVHVEVVPGKVIGNARGLEGRVEQPRAATAGQVDGQKQRKCAISQQCRDSPDVGGVGCHRRQSQEGVDMSPPMARNHLHRHALLSAVGLPAALGRWALLALRRLLRLAGG